MFGHFTTLCMKGLNGLTDNTLGNEIIAFARQSVFTCSKSTIETPGKGVKYVQS